MISYDSRTLWGSCVRRRTIEEPLEVIEPRRIAIIKPSALGDVVQTLPLLPALRKRFPGSWIAWVVQRELSDLVTGHPDLDQVLAIDRRPSWSAGRRFLGELRRQQFDLVLDLQGLLRSAVMTWTTGAKWRIGLETAREGAAYAVNITLPETGRTVPAHARYWRVAEALGVGDVRRRALVQVSVNDHHHARQLLRNLPRPIFAVQWGARWETKRWPLERMVDVAARAGNMWGASVVFVGGPGERNSCDAALRRLGEHSSSTTAINLAGRTSLKQLAAVLTQVDAVIANDSGPMHLAAELGTPVLGIFTCTSPVRSGPPGWAHEMVSTTAPCAASYHKECPFEGARHHACHVELTTERVWQGLVRLVDRNQLLARRHAA